MNDHHQQPNTRTADTQVSFEQPSVSLYDKPKKHRKKRSFRWIIFGSIVVLLSIVGAFFGVLLAQQIGDQTSTRTTSLDGTTAPAVVTNDEETIAAVAEKVSASVVSIVTSSGGSSYYEYEGAGTGVIISSDGYVMTNNHVIDGAENVSVVADDGTTYDDVTIIGSDPLNDIAFLKIKSSTSFTPVIFGDSSSLRIGQRVVAVGNALGQFQNTVTSGIISGKGRPLVASSADGSSSENLTDLIQTDAAINSGNSGGPLLDLTGRVVGINTAVATDANGIGFAIPINATKGIVKSVTETGKISKAYLGLRYLEITPEVISEYKLSEKNGAYITTSRGEAVISESPAEVAGIQSNDVIVKINTQRVGIDGGMSSLLGQYVPGDSISITLIRNGVERVVQVTLGSV